MILNLLFLFLGQADGAAIAPATTAPATQPTSTPPTTQPQTKTLASQMSDLLGPTFMETSWLGWLILLVGIAAGYIGGRIVQATLLRLHDQLHKRGWEVRGAIFKYAAGPAKLALFTLGLAFGMQRLHFEKGSPLPDVVLKSIGFLYIVAIGWFLYNLVDLVDLALRRMTARSTTKLDDTVVTLLRKALRIFLLIMMALFVAQNVFGQNITSFLAGLGIAGLAVSLAAQDSIKNLFGSITVLLSRPFSLGDRIVFGPYDGIVENISFRDTKIRTAGGHLVTVPNMKFTDGNIENITARPFVARTMTIGLACDTPPKRVAEAVEVIRRVLNEPQMLEFINMPDRAPRVYFKDFTPTSLELQVIYAYAIKAPGRDWWTYMEHAQQLNLKIFEALKNAGIQLAFPTQTVYLAGDPTRKLSINLPDTDGENASSKLRNANRE